MNRSQHGPRSSALRAIKGAFEPRRMLATERIALEPLGEAHAAEMFTVMSDPEIYTFIPDYPPLTRSALAHRYRRLAVGFSADRSQRWLNWIIRLRASEECVGYVQATVWADHSANFGFVLHSKFWGQGIAFEACRLALDFLVEEMNVPMLYATVDRQNERSLRLLHRLGFTTIESTAYPHGPPEPYDLVFQFIPCSTRS